MTGGEDSKLNVWRCSAQGEDMVSEPMDIDVLPRKRVGNTDQNVGNDIFEAAIKLLIFLAESEESTYFMIRPENTLTSISCTHIIED